MNQKQPNKGRVQIFTNGHWVNVMGHPIFGDAFRQAGFRASVEQARKTSKPQPYHKTQIRVYG